MGFKHPEKSPQAQQNKPKKHKNGRHRRIESLLNMGFDEEQSLNALKNNNNDVQRAIEYLLKRSKEDDLDDFVLVNDEEEKKKDAEWEQITMNDLKNHHISPHDMELENEYQCTLISPFKLKQIITKCPTRCHLYKWRLMYSTQNDGISINTLYKNMDNAEDSIIIINTVQDTIFGAFIDCKWTDPKTKKIDYKGTIDCFVFNYIQNNEIKDKDQSQLTIYRGSGIKKYFFRNDDHSVTIGAGECPAIYFDYDFSLGRSVKCDSFRSPPLTKDTPFKIKKLEIWAPIIAHH